MVYCVPRPISTGPEVQADPVEEVVVAAKVDKEEVVAAAKVDEKDCQPLQQRLAKLRAPQQTQATLKMAYHVPLPISEEGPQALPRMTLLICFLPTALIAQKGADSVVPCREEEALVSTHRCIRPQLCYLTVVIIRFLTVVIIRYPALGTGHLEAAV
jgi:hypothetical protein